MHAQKFFAILAALSLLGSEAYAQQAPIAVERPKAPVLVRPYKQPTVPPIRLKNSDRLRSLIRAGKMYLTVQDAIALAIENNLDLEVDRYGPLMAEWQVERQQAGGPLRGVTGGNTLVNQATSGQGIAGSQVSAGLAGGGQNIGGGGAGAAVVSQIGPITPNLDPVLQNGSAYSHITTPQPNTVQSRTPSLVDTRHIYNTVVQQGLLSGGIVQVSANESYLKENTPTDILNPSVAPVVQVFVRHNFLQGFGDAVNSRFIRVAEKNVNLAGETFRSQLLNLVANVLNLYWNVATQYEDLKARRRSLEVAQKFYNDTRRQIELSALAKVDIYRAQAELTARRQEVAISETTVRQQENLLKSALSRDGLEDPLVDAAEIVPLDRIEVPAQEELPPLRDLVATALKNRPDVALAKINQETAEISALGTASSVLPILQGLGAVTGTGLSGRANPQPDGTTADPYYVGGLGNALGQIFRRNFPGWRTAVLFEGVIHNRVAQGDYGIDQLQLRQNELVNRRSMNQIVVDISNQMIALRQARLRYSDAVDTRALQEQLLEKEQRKFALGASTINAVVIVQRSLAVARAAEVAALATYEHAHISLDQVLGETLEKNNVSIDEALEGQVARVSKAPGP
ncbi:MAG TPA: TolC family protein [Bryobacteraceae bacterium]|nr:TolC family protein [Bryobacteraceae bacterium]